MRIFLLCLFSLLILNCFAKDLEIESFSERPEDLSANTFPVRDLNNNKCALIKLVIPEKAAFEGNIIKAEYNTNEYYIYISPGTKKIAVKYPVVESLDVQLSDYVDGRGVMSGRTYRLKLGGIPEEIQQVQVISQTQEASQIVDKKSQEEKQDRILLDLSKTIICGLDSIDFSSYLERQHGDNKDYAKSVFDKFTTSFSNSFFNFKTHDIFDSYNLIGLLSIKEINLHGEFNGVFYIKDLNNKNRILISVPFDFTKKHNNNVLNRENALLFDGLFYENAGKGGTELAKKLIEADFYKEDVKKEIELYDKYNKTLPSENGYQVNVTKVYFEGGKKLTEKKTTRFTTLNEAIDFTTKMEKQSSKNIKYKCEIKPIK